MSISVDVYIYNKDLLLSSLKDWGADDKELTIKILDKCGYFTGDSYVILNNELYEDGNPFYKIADLFDSAFKGKNSFDIFLAQRSDGINYVEIGDIAEELGIELIDEDDQEEE